MSRNVFITGASSGIMQDWLWDLKNFKSIALWIWK